MNKYHMNTHICGVEDVYDPLQCGVALSFLLLANQLNVPQLTKVKISLLLHVLNGRFQHLHLCMGG